MLTYLPTYIYALGAVSIVSLISLIGVFSLSRILASPNTTKYLVSLAAGALLGDAFIHLIPESFEHIKAIYASSLIILGIIVFFILEKVLHWHHHHGKVHTNECIDCEDNLEPKINPIGRMVLISDGIHNFVDGLIVAGSFFVSIEIGITTTIAIILHEIPQEIGDFGILIHAGYTKSRAIFLNFISALMAFLGVIVAFFLGSAGEVPVTYILPVAAGGFIYIAAADIFPALQKTYSPKKSLLQLLIILIGLALMFALLLVD